MLTEQELQSLERCVKMGITIPGKDVLALVECVRKLKQALGEVLDQAKEDEECHGA